jgi:hypothetical protein
VGTKSDRRNPITGRRPSQWFLQPYWNYLIRTKQIPFDAQGNRIEPREPLTKDNDDKNSGA